VLILLDRAGIPIGRLGGDSIRQTDQADGQSQCQRT
jgi:hypothetical protein